MILRDWYVLPLIAATAVATARPALAAWPTQPEVAGISVSGLPSIKTFVKAASDGAGGAIVVWRDSRLSAQPDLYAQRVDADGVVRWGANGVQLSASSDFEDLLEMIPDGQGGAFIAWNGGVPTRRLRVQRVNSAGVAMWGSDGVEVVAGVGVSAYPRLAADDQGGVFVVWEDSRGQNDVYGQHLHGSGAPLWTVGGVVLAGGIFVQRNPQVTPDGSGGLFLAFDDGTEEANFFTNVRVQHVSASGNPLWAAAGVRIVQQPNGQAVRALVADQEGGVIVLWKDDRVADTAQRMYAQRVSSSGYPRWPSDGVLANPFSLALSDIAMISDGANGALIGYASQTPGIYAVEMYRLLPSGGTGWNFGTATLFSSSQPIDQVNMTSDGRGGAIVCWSDLRSGPVPGTRAQRMRADGVQAWLVGGVPVALPAGAVYGHSIVSDGRDGAIVGWNRFLPDVDEVRVQRVESFGVLGSPEPVIASVRDLAADQGGRVKVSWARSYLDDDPAYGVESYRLWRSAPTAGAGVGRRPEATRDPDVAAATGALFERAFAGVTYAWEWVGTQVADGLPNYSFLATTTTDSIAGSNPRTVFMVEARAHSTASGPRWFSAPDSGYSVDNLPPLAPAALAGSFANGAMQLTWSANGEADLAGYRVYRGATPAFAVGAATLVGATSDPHFRDPAPRLFVYKVTAVDTHGNESQVATFVPAGTVGTESPSVTTLAFTLASASPSRGGATFALELPAQTHADIALFDAQGRELRALHAGTLPAGRHVMRWDGRDSGGDPIPPGVLFARCVVDGHAITRRLVVTR